MLSWEARGGELLLSLIVSTVPPLASINMTTLLKAKEPLFV